MVADSVRAGEADGGLVVIVAVDGLRRRPWSESGQSEHCEDEERRHH